MVASKYIKWFGPQYAICFDLSRRIGGRGFPQFELSRVKYGEKSPEGLGGDLSYRG